MAASINGTSFDIRAFQSGGPMTIYIEVPPLKMSSGKLLVDLWVNALLALGFSGTSESRTLYVIDSPFSGDLFDVLYPVQESSFAQLWTFWGSLGQLRAGRAGKWSAFLARARRVEALGPVNPVVAGELRPCSAYRERPFNRSPRVGP